MSRLVAFLVGLTFALGLGMSGMTRPSIVLGFLDVTGAWNPALLFVMVGAVTTYAALSRWIGRRTCPVLEPAFVLPTRKDLDAALIGGAAIFGVGWGLVGLCPGPALVALGAAVPQALVFVGAMAAGMLLYDWRSKDA